MQFQRMATNIIKENFSMMPGLAFTQRSVRDAAEQGGEEAAKMYANQALGGTIMTYALYKAMRGELAGRGPTDAELRQQRKDNGMDAYTLTHGGHTMSLTRLNPGGPLAMMSADAYSGIKSIEDHVQRVAEYRAAAGMNKHAYMDKHPIFQNLRQIADAWDATRGTESEDGLHAFYGVGATIAGSLPTTDYTKGWASLFDAMASPTADKFQQWGADRAAEMVPGGAFFSSLDPTPRTEARGMIEHMLQKTPGFARSGKYTLEPHRNILGEKGEIQPGFLDWANGHINPFTIGKATGNDKLQTELLDLGKAMPMPPKTTPGIAGAAPIDWTDREKYGFGPTNQSPYDRVLELKSTQMFPWKGEKMNARQVMEAVLSSDEYKALPLATPDDPEGPRARMASRVMEMMNKYAEQAMFKEHPDFARLVSANKWTTRAGRTGRDSLMKEVYRNQLHPAPQAPDTAAPTPGGGITAPVPQLGPS
jgi:hypothetical protein